MVGESALRGRLSLLSVCYDDRVSIQITVDNLIRMNTANLDPKVIRDAQDVMTVPNKEKLAAEKQHLWGADRLDDSVQLYRWDNEDLILPRGFYLRLTSSLKKADYKLDIVNRMTVDKELDYLPFKDVPLRTYQQDALKDLAYYAQGIYQAPTGSGKTITMLGLIQYLSQRTLVIVNKKELVQQWVDRSEQFLGYTPGFIGDGRWEEKPFTIAMEQTLWSRRDVIGIDVPGWWDKWGMVILDECHAVQADTYNHVMQRFRAMYRFGVSATPKKTGDFKVCEATLGPIIHTTPKKPLRAQGYLITPEVFTVPTQFYYPFHPNLISEKTGRVTKRNNFHDVVKHLVTDDTRNSLIADTAENLDKRTILILSKRLEHLDLLRLKLQGRREVLLLTGAESLSERMNVYARASHGNCIILSTLADEGVDIPRIDTVFFVFPVKNTELVRQWIGRGERPHPEKKDFWIFDFVDFSIPPIKTQYRDRRNFVYRPEDIKVTKLKI